MPTTLGNSNHINQQAADGTKSDWESAEASVLAQPALRTTAISTMGPRHASLRATARSNSGSETNVDILPQHIRRGPHGSFEWDHGISPQRGPYKDDPHGHVNDYFGPFKAVSSGATENHRQSVMAKPSLTSKDGARSIPFSSQQIQAKPDQEDALFKHSKNVFCGLEVSKSSLNRPNVVGSAVKAGEESCDTN